LNQQLELRLTELLRTGLITPPIIFANYLALDASYQSYMISASLISSGILSMMQMSKIHLFKGYYLGSGLLCVMGTSFGEQVSVPRLLPSINLLLS
jgi:xanthine/uracil permease